MTRLPTYYISHGGGPWPWLPQMRAQFRNLEASLKLEPGLDAYILLGQLLEELDEPQNAALFYRQAALLAADRLEHRSVPGVVRGVAP